MNTQSASARPVSQSSLADLVGSLQYTVGRRLTCEFRDALPGALIRRALDEAAHAAWSTEFPHLFVPALAEERVRLVYAAVRPESEGHRGLRRAA